MDLTKRDVEIAGCLRRLFKTRFMVRSRSEKWFQTIVDYREPLQKHLDPFAIHLEINEMLGVIYLRPKSDEVEETLSYQLGRKRQLSAVGSLTLLYLREQRVQFFLNPNQDAVPLISQTELREFLSHFNHTKVDSQFERLFRKAIEELVELQVLFETEANSGLYEISALTDILLPLGQIKEYQLKIREYFKGSGSIVSTEEGEA